MAEESEKECNKGTRDQNQKRIRCYAIGFKEGERDHKLKNASDLW